MSNINYFLQIKKDIYFKILPVLALSFLRKCVFLLKSLTGLSMKLFFTAVGLSSAFFPELYFS